MHEGKGKGVPQVFPVPLPLQTAVTQAMKKPTCRPQVDNRLFTGILASILLDSLSFGLTCSRRSDNREQTKIGREKKMNSGEGKERKESPTGVPTTLFLVLPLLFLAFFTSRHSLLSERRLEQATLTFGLSLYPISLFPFREIRSRFYEGFFPSFRFHNL